MDTAQKMCSLAADDKVDVLRAWHLAGVDFSAGDYDRRTALHVVSVSTRDGKQTLIAFSSYVCNR